MSRVMKLGLASLVIAAGLAFSGAKKAEAHRWGWYGYYGRPYISYRAYYPYRTYYAPAYRYRPRVTFYGPAYYGGPIYYGGGGFCH